MKNYFYETRIMEEINKLDPKKLFTTYFNLAERTKGKSQVISTITLVQITPVFKIIQKELSLNNIFGSNYTEFIGKIENTGIEIKSSKFNFSITNYESFLKTLFPNLTIYDNQQVGDGQPDFKLSNGDVHFHIELKRNGDGIRKSQLDWLIKNPTEEVYFLFIKEGNNYY